MAKVMVIDITRCNSNEDMQLAQKCTWCAHLLDRGWTGPRRVDSCPAGAFSFGEEEDFRERIASGEMSKAENKPRTYYTGIPKRFIAGAVYDPEDDECLEGAKVTLTDGDGSEVAVAVTDDFGDFWFEGLEVAEYALGIEKAGFLPQRVDRVSTEKDTNVGDMALHKKG